MHKTSAWAYMSPFGSFALKEEAKRQKALEQLRQQEQQAEFVRQQQAAQAAREAAALEDQRAKVVSRISELQNSALAAAAVITQIRNLAADRLLEDDPFLINLEAELSDMEASVVKVQSGTVINTASNDPHVLAVSYSDAQGALIAIQAVRSRAAGLRDELNNYLMELQADAVRSEQNARVQQYEAEAERQRQAKIAAKQAEQRAREERAQQLAQQNQNMILLSQLQIEIAREREALRRARSEYASYLSRTG